MRPFSSVSLLLSLLKEQMCRRGRKAICVRGHVLSELYNIGHYSHYHHCVRVGNKQVSHRGWDTKNRGKNKGKNVSKRKTLFASLLINAKRDIGCDLGHKLQELSASFHGPPKSLAGELISLRSRDVHQTYSRALHARQPLLTLCKMSKMLRGSRNHSRLEDGDPRVGDAVDLQTLPSPLRFEGLAVRAATFGTTMKQKRSRLGL